MTLPSPEFLRERLRYLIAEEEQAGVDVGHLAETLDEVPLEYAALEEVAQDLTSRPMRGDWPYEEPESLAEIRAAADDARATERVWSGEAGEAASRARAAFLTSVAGCMLGKPFEIDPTLDEVRAALEPTGEWPLRDYPSEAAVRALRELQPQWRELVRERIDHVAADDDINYTVIGMLVLERHGLDFTNEDLLRVWLYNLPVLATFGPERTLLVRAATAALEPGAPFAIDEWRRTWNPGSELCGGLIRADAYGYACLGHPELAADLAYRDAAMTHRRTGVYGAMFVAAAIALAPGATDPLDLMSAALRYVPQRSRFAEAVRFALERVGSASSWIDGYRAINARYGDYGHCRILQEVGTLVNTTRFAEDAGHGICLQVMQGNDTDSFGATAGSILGAYFGELDPRWTAPFGDRIQLALATTWVSSLSELAGRMAALPALSQTGETAS